MIFNTGLRQSLAVRTSTVYVLTARLCRNPVKYFTDKKSRALAKISQNPASNALQVLELVYNNLERGLTSTVCLGKLKTYTQFHCSQQQVIRQLLKKIHKIRRKSLNRNLIFLIGGDFGGYLLSQYLVT